MLRAMISHAKPSYTRLMQGRVIPTFMQVKKESRRDLSREGGGNAVNVLKDASLVHDLARQITITIEQKPDLP